MSQSDFSIRALQDLDRVAERGRKTLYPERPKILVGLATSGRASGGEDVMAAIREEAVKSGLDLLVTETGCIGWCSQEPMQTCGECHNTEFIQSHAFHSDLGLSDYTETGKLNASGGIFGNWDPLTYRYLSQTSDERLDLSTAEWLMTNGYCVVGGGPADTSRDGKNLVTLKANATNPETNILNTETGQPETWNWKNSGTMEMNCFLCHMYNPKYDARREALKSGQFDLANTATLFDNGLVTQPADGIQWNKLAFQENGEISEDNVFIKIKDPTSWNICPGERSNRNWGRPSPGRLPSRLFFQSHADSPMLTSIAGVIHRDVKPANILMKEENPYPS